VATEPSSRTDGAGLPADVGHSSVLGCRLSGLRSDRQGMSGRRSTKCKTLIAPAMAAALELAAPAVILPAHAQASAITECGNFVQTTAWERGYWTFGMVPGFTPVTNLTTRNVRCSDARPYSFHVMNILPPYGSRRNVHSHNFTCRIAWSYWEDWDVRCTRGSQVIHWQGGGA
jgi:hypothetical protein